MSLQCGLVAFVLGLTMILTSCPTPLSDQIIKGRVVAVSSTSTGSIVCAGYDKGGNLSFWVDGQKTILSGPSGGKANVNCLYVDGTEIYTAGRDETASACYWKGAEKTVLVSADGWVNSIQVQNGVVYCAGTSDVWSGGCYWVGTHEHDISSESDFETISVDAGGHIYLLGTDRNWAGCYWRDGDKTVLSTDTTTLRFDMYVDNGIVYTCGHDENNHAAFWTGDNETKLSNSTRSDADSIIVAFGHVYTVGENGYWIDSKFVSLGSFTSSVSALGSSILIGGTDQEGFACFWKDGVITRLL